MGLVHPAATRSGVAGERFSWQNVESTAAFELCSICALAIEGGENAVDFGIKENLGSEI
jgi:hypothetical protein